MKNLAIILSALFLTSCAVPPEIQKYENTSGIFKKSVTLCGIYNRGYLFFPDNEYYIVRYPCKDNEGVIPAGTHYIVSEITSGGESGGTVFHMTITSGKFTNYKVRSSCASEMFKYQSKDEEWCRY